MSIFDGLVIVLTQNSWHEGINAFLLGIQWRTKDKARPLEWVSVSVAFML